MTKQQQKGRWAATLGISIIFIVAIAELFLYGLNPTIWLT